MQKRFIIRSPVLLSSTDPPNRVVGANAE